MNESEILSLVRRELARQLNIILTGKTANSTGDTASEDIKEMYPGMPTIEVRPVMHPYGFASRAIDDTISVVAMQGAQKQNRVIIGHRDGKRPKLDDAGDVILYDGTGKHIVKLSKSKGIEIDAGSDDPVSIKGKAVTVDAGSSAVATVKGKEVDITGTTKVVVDAPEVDLTASPSDFVGLANLIKTELTKVALSFTTLTSPAGPVTGGTYTTPGNVASTKVKCG